MNIRYYSNVIIYRIVEWCTPVNARQWAGSLWQADVLPSKATTPSPPSAFPIKSAIKRETERFPTTQTSTGQTPEAWSEFLSHCTFWRIPLFLNVVISVNISPAHHTQIWNSVTIGYNCRIAINSVNASDVSLEGSDGVGAVRVAACFGVSGICMNKVGMPKLSRW